MRILIAFLLCASISFGQDALTKEQINALSINQIVAKIAENDYVAPYPDGFFFGETEQHLLYQQLKLKASNEQLLKFVKDIRPIVRVYAVICLDDNKYDQLYTLAQEHLKDTDLVSVSTMHQPVKHKVGEFFASVNSLSEKQRHDLDSIIFFTCDNLGYIYSILDKLPIEEKYYLRLKELAKNNPHALNTLAKFKKPEDIEFIASNILENSHYKYEAIENFPAEPFKKTLFTLREQGYHLYGMELAAAAFQDQFSVDFFNYSLDKYSGNSYAKSENARYIVEAIRKYHHPIFQNLYFRIWEDYNKIDRASFEYLRSVNAEKSLQLTKATLLNYNDFTDKYSVITPLLDFVSEKDTNEAKRIILIHINRAHYDNLFQFTEKASEFKDAKLTEAMLTQLTKAKNPYVYLPLTEGILRYKNDSLNNKLLEILRNNTEIKDWGAKDLDKLLEVHGLKR